MNKSDSIVNLTKAIFDFQKALGNISKDSVNPFHHNKYASLTAILEGINEPLLDAGLIVLQTPGNDEDKITLDTIIMHAETSEFISSMYSMRPVKQDPQAIGSCITYMRRYALSSILKLNVDDDDGNAASSVQKKSDLINSRISESRKKEVKNKEYSKEFLDVMDKINKCDSIDELNDLGSTIKERISSEDEISDLRSFFAKRQAALKG